MRFTIGQALQEPQSREKKGGKHKKISFATALWLCLVPQRTKCVEAQSEGKSTFFIQSKTASSLIGGEGGGTSAVEKKKKNKSQTGR